LHADDLPALVLGDRVPDGHLIGGQVQLVGARQWVLGRKGGGQRRDWVVQQLEDRTLHDPPQCAGSYRFSWARRAQSSQRVGLVTSKVWASSM
jgi:hypothetical protein